MRFLLSLGIVVFLLGSGGVAAQEGRVGLELNKLEPATGACRAYVVLQNGSGKAFTALKLDLVMFDADGIVAKRLALETAPLPSDKTSLKVFDIGGMTCDQVGRILLNDVLECADAAGAQENCLGLIDVTARGDLSLIK